MEYEGFFSQAQETIKDAVEEQNEFNGFVGHRDYKKATYPALQYIPGEITYDSGREYNSQHTFFFIFKRGKKGSKIIENMKKTEKTMDYLENEIKGISCASTLRVTNITPMVSETSGNLLDIIEVTFTVGRLQE